MVDTAVAADAPALRGADLLQRSWGPPDAAEADSGHGTEVAASDELTQALVRAGQAGAAQCQGENSVTHGHFLLPLWRQA